jgi:hypothetical protein
MIDLVAWGVGYALNKSGDWVKDSVLFRKDLVEALSDTAEKWNEELPKKYRIDNPETLFKPVAKENLDGLPHHQALRELLKDGQIPEPDIWAAAAYEHVHAVRQKLADPKNVIWAKVALEQVHAIRRKLADDVNPICEADDEEIMPHLNELGRRLTLTIMQDAKTTLPLIYRQLQHIESKLDQLSTVSSKRDTI